MSRSFLQRGLTRGAFTLIELLLATVAGAVLLASVLTVYWRALHLRSQSTDRAREVRVQAHAVSVLRSDLRNARLSGGTMAATLDTTGTGHSRFPGDLRFTTTTGTLSDDVPSADVQEVEYYITDTPGSDGKSGTLVRTVNPNVLTSQPATLPEETLLPGVSAMDVSFYDGSTWQDSWTVDPTDVTAPKGVRVHLTMAADLGAALPVRPIEVLVPWTTDIAITPPAASTDADVTGSGAAVGGTGAKGSGTGGKTGAGTGAGTGTGAAPSAGAGSGAAAAGGAR